MFLGEYQHNIDQKGRINVPAKFREILGTSFVLTKGLDGCLFVYHLDDWKKFEEKFAQIPISNSDARKFIRYFFSSAVVCEPDNLGRINIPQNLRDHAELKKEVVSIGSINRVEIWDRDKWNKYNNPDNYNDDELAAKMAEFGI